MTTTPNVTPEQVVGGLTILKEIVGFFKKKKKNKTASALKIKGTDCNGIAKDLPEILIIELDGSQYLINKEDTPPILFEYVKRQKADKLKNKTIDLVRTDYNPEVEYVKENYAVGIKQVPTGLNNEYSALLIMSRNIKKYFDVGNVRAGNTLKSNLSLIYGPEGNLFCNLYSKGYLIKAFEHFDQLVKYGAIHPEKINHFLSVYIRNWDSVFFVHLHIDAKEICAKIQFAFNAGKDYVAIHGINSTNVETINAVHSSMVSCSLVDTLKYTTKISEGNIKRENSILPIKDIYFFTKKGKIIYEEFQLKSI